MVRTERGGSARLMLVGRIGNAAHKGTLNLIDWWVENYSCGPYASKHPGKVRVEGGLFGTNVDISGATDDFGIIIDERDGTRLNNSCIELPNTLRRARRRHREHHHQHRRPR
jgi:hypothetical protein